MAHRMHLPAKVPNEGARRLAWWLGPRGSAGFDELASALEVHAGVIDRLLSGEVEPGQDLSFAIALVTARAVWVRDWRQAPEGGWFDRPAPRELARAA